MPQLVHARMLSWDQLPYLESPFFAKSDIQQAVNTYLARGVRSPGGISNLESWIGQHRGLMNNLRRDVWESVERGDSYYVHHLNRKPAQPLLIWKKANADAKTDALWGQNGQWHIADHVPAGLRNRLAFVLKQIQPPKPVVLRKAPNGITPVNTIQPERQARKKEDKPEEKQTLPEFNSTYAHDQLMSIAKTMGEAGFITLMVPIFGEEVSGEAYRQLFRDLCDGILPPPEFVIEANTIEGHWAAFNSDDESIYLYQQIILDAIEEKKRGAQILISALVEEYGHYIDHKLRNTYSNIGGDAKNDEGAVFAYQIAFHGLLDADLHEYARVKTDDFDGALALDMSEAKAAIEENANEREQLQDGQSGSFEFFGAGMGDENNLRSYGHEKIEVVLSSIEFSDVELKKIYFGNWLRDYSQIIDPGLVRPASDIIQQAQNNYGIGNIDQSADLDGVRLSRATLTKLVGVLALKFFKKDYPDLALSFQKLLWGEKGQEILGCYRPEEHIDNPLPGPRDKRNEWSDGKLIDDCFAPLPTDQQLQINPVSLIKNHIATDVLKADGSPDQERMSAASYMKSRIEHAIDCGRTDEGLRAFGEGLHVLEDYFAHSNFVEVALIELGYLDVYPWVDEKINGHYPIVTGCFGRLDVLHSIAPKLAELIPHELEPYDSGNFKNIAPEGETPVWRCEDDYIILTILEDIDGAQAVNENESSANYKGDSELWMLQRYKEYLDLRDLKINGKSNILIEWLFIAIHHSIQFIIFGMGITNYLIVKPLSHMVDDYQTFSQDMEAKSVGIDPTHSQLAKDHDNHHFHDIAAELATMAVANVGQRLMDSYTGRINEVNAAELAIQYLCHPKDCDWYIDKLKLWGERNPDRIERAKSRSSVEHTVHKHRSAVEELNEKYGSGLGKAKRKIQGVFKELYENE